MARTFYSKLYSAFTDCDGSLETKSFLDILDFPKLSEDSRKGLEGKLSSKECLEVLKTMKHGKTPGSDGFPAEFYQLFLMIYMFCLLTP